MADSYDGNGDYSSYNEEDNDYSKQRKNAGGGGGPHNGDNVNHDHHHHHGGGSAGGGPMGSHDGQQMNDKTNEYIRECLTEKSRMDKKFPIAEKLLDCGESNWY